MSIENPSNITISDHLDGLIAATTDLRAAQAELELEADRLRAELDATKAELASAKAKLVAPVTFDAALAAVDPLLANLTAVYQAECPSYSVEERILKTVAIKSRIKVLDGLEGTIKAPVKAHMAEQGLRKLCVTGTPHYGQLVDQDREKFLKGEARKVLTPEQYAAVTEVNTSVAFTVK